ncbi:MAG: Sugar phosphate permease [Chloroflexi bacterium]|nr:MAG: Sugar phosphate permease [Chloroflexota bacterium]
MVRKWPFYYGWVIVGVVVLAGLADTIQTLPVLSIFLLPITEEFGWSRTTYTSAITIGTIMGALMAPFVGRLLDRYGGRWMLVGAFVVLGGSMILLSTVSVLWQFFALQILARLMHMGVITVALMGSIIPRWFVLRRGRAVAISGMGLRGGLTLNPLFVQFLVARGTWRTAAVGVGILVWVLSLLPIAIFLRRKPEDVGLLPDGETPEHREERLRRAAASTDATSRDLDASLTLHEVLRLPSFYLMAISFSLAMTITSGISFHAIPYFTDQGLGGGAAVGLVSLYGAVAAGGMLASGFVIERVNVRFTLVVTTAIMGLAMLYMMAADTVPLGLVWSITFGLAEGSVFVTQQVAFADYFGRESLGSIRGVLMTMQILANAVGAMAGAIVFDVTDTYWPLLLAFGTCGLVSAFLMFLARPPKMKSMRAAPQ